MDEDKDLISAFRIPQSREAAFRDIIFKYQRKIYYQIRRIVIDHDDANDVVQNVFIKAWKGLDGFNEESRLSTWLYRIAYNESINFIKSKKASLFVSSDEFEHVLDDHITDTSGFTGEQIEQKLQKALQTLPEKQRLVFNMKYFSSMKYEEMSEVLGTSVGALKASYHHAVKKIEEYFRVN